MSHHIIAKIAGGDTILNVNVSGDMSAFYKHFDCETPHGPSGNDSFTTTVELAQAFLDTPFDMEKGRGTAEYILRRELDLAICSGFDPDTTLFFNCF